MKSLYEYPLPIPLWLLCLFGILAPVGSLRADPPPLLPGLPEDISRWETEKIEGGTLYCSDSAAQLYLVVPARPAGDAVRFPRRYNVVRFVALKLGPEMRELQLSQDPITWTVHLPEEVLYPAVVEVQLGQDALTASQTPVVRPSPDGAIVLSARHAEVHGQNLQFEPQVHKNTVGYWVNAADWVDWQFAAPAGNYEVWILQGCGNGQGGSRVALSVSRQQLEFDVQETGHFQNFVWRALGPVTLDEASTFRLSLRVLNRTRDAVMDVRQIRLEPSTNTLVQDAPKQMSDVEPDLVVPWLREGRPSPGRRVRLKLPGREQQPAYHALYLPTDWTAERSWPMLVEVTGNGPYQNARGDRCSGLVADAALGLGISGGFGWIWLTVPCLDQAGERETKQWWGDPPEFDVHPTIEYWQAAIDQVAERYGGDPRRVVLVGFSRGSLACNYLGLHDDSISQHWAAFVCNSHYDGVLTTWPYPNCGAQAARQRLRRLQGRPQFICSETGDFAGGLSDTRRFLQSASQAGDFTFASTGFVDHSDTWALRPSRCRRQLRDWLEQVAGDPAATEP